MAEKELLTIFFYEKLKALKIHIQLCQKKKHVQQVAYSTYHDALTQVCFTCKSVRSNIKKSDLNG